MNKPLDLCHDGEVVHATLCQPERTNALNTPLIAALALFFEKAQCQPVWR